MSIHDIISEINESNSTNHKLAVLKKYKDDELLQQILKMTYDTVAFTYGVSLEQIEKFESQQLEIPINLQYTLAAIVHELSTRKRTGHAALQMAANLIGNLQADDAELVKKIINRDLRINAGKTLINKVWKGLITKPVYMRCDVYSDKTAKNIKFPAILQLKADGTYREFQVHNGNVGARSRSGEEYNYPILNNTLVQYPDGVYAGELTVKVSERIIAILEEKLAKSKDPEKLLDVIARCKNSLQKGEEYILPREIGNGLIKSDDVPHDDVILDLWDYVTLDEYEQASYKDKKNPCTTKYVDRLKTLQETIDQTPGQNVRMIETWVVDTIQEALQKTSEWMNEGLEGSILKDMNGVFKDGTSKQQLKLKIKIDCEMRILGYREGTKGTKREGKVGSIIFGNDEGTIKGRASGFSDEQLDEFTENWDEYESKVMTVQFNDLTRADGNDYWALSHPRFIEIRDDKDETDTLEKVLELREMAIQLK